MQLIVDYTRALPRFKLFIRALALAQLQKLIVIRQRLLEDVQMIV
jgi:hypothetical protein